MLEFPSHFECADLDAQNQFVESSLTKLSPKITVVSIYIYIYINLLSQSDIRLLSSLILNAPRLLPRCHFCPQGVPFGPAAENVKNLVWPKIGR